MGLLHRFNVNGDFQHVRFIILAVSSFYLASIQASIFAFHVAYVEMADRSTSPLLAEYLDLVLIQTVAGTIGSGSSTNGTLDPSSVLAVDFDWAPSRLKLSEQRYTFAPLHKSCAFAGTFAGSLFGTFPMLYSLRRVGARKTMAIIGAVCALLCTLTPVSIAVSFWLFVALRFTTGFVAAPILPLMGAIIEDWGAMGEKGLFISCLSASMEIAMLFTLPVGALIAEKISWPSTYYIHGLICAFFTALLVVVYRDDPAVHPLLSVDEVKRIKQGKSGAVDQEACPSTRAVLTSKAVWAVFIAAMGTYFVAQFIVTFSPQYFTAVLGYTTTISGTLTIIPTIALLPVKLITGLISDRLSMLSEVCKLRLFNSLSSFLAAAVFIVAIFVRPGVNDAAATALIILPFICFGFVTGGFHKAAVLIARQHAPFVFSLMHIFNMIALLAATFFIPLLTPDNTFAQWKIVFIIFSAALIVSNVVFTVFVKADPEEWAAPKVEASEATEEPSAAEQRPSTI